MAKRAAKAKAVSGKKTVPGKKKTVPGQKSAGKPAGSAAGLRPIDLYYWATPNGFKISIMLEECKLPYTLHPVNIAKGEQFKPEFLKNLPE